jgi:hypothetical protein
VQDSDAKERLPQKSYGTLVISAAGSDFNHMIGMPRECGCKSVGIMIELASTQVIPSSYLGRRLMAVILAPFSRNSFIGDWVIAIGIGRSLLN